MHQKTKQQQATASPPRLKKKGTKKPQNQTKNPQTETTTKKTQTSD